MKSVIGLLLTLSLVLQACSADNGSSDATTQPAANANATTTAAQPAPANTDTPLVVAQAQTSTTAQTPAPSPAVAAPAARSDIIAGRHYRELTPAKGTSSSPDKVEVAEVFMYSCPHCMDFEPFVENYLAAKPNYVSFVRIPASFNPTARLHTKAYYMAETMGVIDDTHMKFFEQYHTKHNHLATEQAVIDFFVDQGLSKTDVTNAYNSFAVDTKVRQADSLARRYGIDSVPAVVINGKYVTSGSMTGSISKLREVIDYLAAKEAAQL